MYNYDAKAIRLNSGKWFWPCFPAIDNESLIIAALGYWILYRKIWK